MGVGYRWHSLRRRIRSMGSESLLLRQLLIAGVLYLTVVGLIQVNLPLTRQIVKHIHWSMVDYKPVISLEKLRSWGEKAIHIPVLGTLSNETKDDLGLPLTGYLIPVEDGQVSSRYGWRLHPITGEKQFHQGIDIAAPLGTPVRSVAGGYISRTDNDQILGKVVEIKHENGMTSIYGHLDVVVVEQRQIVKGGDVIGSVGESGICSGPHLHLEIKDRGVNVDPAIKLGLIQDIIVPADTAGESDDSGGSYELEATEKVNS